MIRVFKVDHFETIVPGNGTRDGERQGSVAESADYLRSVRAQIFFARSAFASRFAASKNFSYDF